jgi:integrase
MARAKKGWLAREIGPGNWQGRAWDPKRVTYKSRSCFATSQEAEDWASMEHAKLKTGLAVSGRLGIDDTLDTYEKDLARRGLEENYRVETMRVLRAAAAGGVTDLRHDNVKEAARDWLASLRTVHPRRLGRVLSPRTLNHHLKVLRAFANWCTEEDLIPHNPFRGIKMVTVDDSAKATFTVDEATRLTNPALLTGDGYGLVVALQMYAGLRTGEALNMRWEWLDFLARNVAIRQWKDIPGNSHPMWRLKRRKERDLPMQPELAALLKPVAQLHGWVVPAEYRHANSKVQKRRLERWCEHCGVTLGDRTPHSTRHSWISMMLASGENQMAVRDMAGHSSLDTTAGYARNQMSYRDAVRDWRRGVLCFHPEKKIAAPLAKANE